jgi:hypothetical protein
MAVARVDRSGYERASTGACPNELSTHAGEKGVHERVNGCGSGGFGSLLARGAGGGGGRGKATPRIFSSGGHPRVWENGESLGSSRMVKKLMRLRVRSISAAPRAVHDTASGLHTLGLG